MSTTEEVKMEQGKTEIDLSRFEHGVYILKLINCNNIYVSKILKE